MSLIFFFSSRGRDTRYWRYCSSDVCSSYLSLYSEGKTILLTTATVIEKGKQAASEHLEASVADIEFTAGQQGRFSVVGTDRGVGILDLARIDRKSVVQGKSVDLGGRRIIKKKTDLKSHSIIMTSSHTHETMKC